MTIQEILEELLSVSEEGMAMYLVGQDPLERKMEDDVKSQLVQQSIAVGKSEANLLRQQFPTATPREIIESLGLKLEHKDEENIATKTGVHYVLLGYYESPDEIVVFDHTIGRMQRYLEGIEHPVFSGISVKDIVLAHEIFHYIEEQKEDLFTNRFKVEVFSLGPFRKQSTVLSAGEIAGMTFAKTLLNLPFEPEILNYIVMRIWNPTAAERTLASMLQYKNK